MKRLLIVIIALAGAYYSFEHSSSTAQRTPEYGSSNAQLEEAMRSRRVDYQVQGRGIVTRVLPDDSEGSRHQRFVVRLDSGDTVLIAHNIDLAPRLPGLQSGESVSFHGEYEWNERGGVVHWTHHDPRGQHVAGWLEYKGKRYH